jgi:putative component of membrane protein insertase Oxa1/YidC/SpoIIIJ protein YidD
MRDVTQFIDNSYRATNGYGKRWAFRKVLPFFDRSLRSIAVLLIGGYQRHLSPRKGYSCAHRIVHGGESCSEYVKNVLADKSLFEATLLAKRRFKACSTTYMSSKDQFFRYKTPDVGPPADICNGETIAMCCGALSIFEVCRQRRR